MGSRFLFRATHLGAGALLLVCAGCSPRARTARHLAEANRSFAADQYDQAEIEYLNVLQAEPENPQAVGRLATIYFDEGLLGRVYPYLVKAGELQPDNLDLRQKLGLLYLRIGKIKEAREAAKFVLEKKPGDVDAPLLLAEAIARPADVEDTVQFLNKLPPTDAKDASVLVALGTLQVHEHHLKEAEELFRRAESADANSVSAKSALGALYWAENDLPQAERFLAAAAELSPRRSPKRLQYAQFKIQTGNPAAGRLMLENITKETPDLIPAWLLLAQVSANEKKFAESAAFNARVLARDAANPEALLLGGRLLIETGETTKAVTEIKRILKFYPRLPPAHYELGMAYLAAGEVGQAAASIKQALALAPDFPDAVVLLAVINVRRGDPSAAIVELKQLVGEHPAIRRAWLTLAGAYRSIGDLDSAIAVCRQMEKEFPGDPQVLWLTGILLGQQNHPDEARQSFERALALSPDYLPALERMVNLELAVRHYRQATELIDSHFSRNPTQGGLLLLRAKVDLAQKDTKAAEAALQQAIKLNPDSPTAYFILAQMYVASNQHARALANLQEVVAKNPKDVEALMLIAVIQDQQKDYATARDTYEKLLAINPRFSAALNNLAYVYSEHFQELDKAFALAQRARELLPHEPHTADTLGWILYHRRQYSWALSLLEESAENLPDSPDLQFHLGATRYMLGQEKSARVALERAVRLGGEATWINEARQDLAVLGLTEGATTAAERTVLEEALAQRKDDPEVLVRLAAIFEGEGDAEKAEKAYQTALQSSPQDVQAILGMAEFAERHGDKAQAFDLAKTARQLAPENPEVAHLLGRVAYGSGNYSWALTLLQESARSQPDNPRLLFDLALAAYSTGHVSDATAELQNALQSKARFAQADEARRFLELLRLAEDPVKAKDAMPRIENILKVNPSDVPALMVLAANKENEGESAAAEAAYNKVLQHFPDFSPAKRRLAILYAADPGDNPGALDLAIKAREAFPNDPELAKALGIINYRRGDFAAAANALKESAGTLGQDAELNYYLGLSLRELGQRADGEKALRLALDLHLEPKLAAEARRVLAASK